VSFVGEATATFEFAGLTFDWAVIISATVAMAIVFFMAFFMARNLTMKPKGKQNFLEWIIDFTNGIVDSALPNATGRSLKFFAFSLFMFIFVSNQLGLAFQVQVGDVTYLKSVTTNPIITLGMALIVLGMAHFIGVQKLGFKKYFKNVYLSPFPALLPINIIEQFTSFLTLGLRLFGNIFAGEMVLQLLWKLAQVDMVVTMVPAFLLTMIWQAFSLFIGAIQAYVFVTLTMVYVSEKTEAE
jgi:F-type H+-transporting ATPase subunit a